MSLEKKTILDQITVASNGVIMLRFGLLILDDGKQLDCKWHRTAIEPGGNIDAQISLVNQHLSALGANAFDDAEKLAQLKTIAETTWTQELIASYRFAQQAA